MNWRVFLRTSIIAVDIGIFLFLYSPIHFDQWDTALCLFILSVLGLIVAGVSESAISSTRWGITYDELKKPFGLERVAILRRKWKLLDLKENLSNPRLLNDAIAQCDKQLERIDQAIIEIYASSLNSPEHEEDMQRVEDLTRRTKEDIRQMLQSPLPAVIRVRQ
jgi:hypothetical protein